MEPEISLAEAIVKCIKAQGAAQQMLKSVLDNELFDDLSKHNLFFQSENEDVSQRLNAIRMSLVYIEDELYKINELLE